MSKLKRMILNALPKSAPTPAQVNARILSSVGLDTVLTPLNKKKKGQIQTVLPTQTQEEMSNVLG